MAKIPAFGELGRTAKDLLYGSRDGVFQFDRVVSISSTTSDGVDFGLKALSKGDRLDIDLKSVYVAPRYTLVSSITRDGKLAAAVTYKDLAPGLTLGLSGTVPELETAKVAVDYSLPHLTLKSVVSLASSPKVDLAATTGYEGVTLGASGTFDASKSALTRWTAGVGYTAPDYQLTALLTDTNALSVLLAHRVAADTTIGAEVSRDLGSSATSFAIGSSRRLAGGALTKAKLENSGILSLLYEQELQPKTKVALSTQLNALDLNAPPKFGVGFDVKY
ncbi:VDAC1 [Auxenochlorella protothecoides x Auxenochlorella symbiontica]|uniref:Mitochondrial outer membrane protein porin 1 n=1 Tax=Auxenochlorella protothecoides TaxID=3075 RepID=A0A087SBZ6_AUXPR|nr:Mitochondrial outer membrane protein porin 1 [Auxenochlorella protothecoides]KFM23250.1 Mitochondrial outer membrane protein porin 1 [Auxenochlorella protothecoides]RMZ53447.1 hypothetical protein APUTEX25_003269 [Auxenochlorella protothecoides]|eukprot:RMZ53447.1 hypothetical protein APUTEX25_003269 [Auxenochlorella protothecoides]